MNQLKKYAAPLGVFALLITAAAGLTFVQHSQAQGTSVNANPRFGKSRAMGPAIAGTVAGINGNSITVTGKNGATYTVDATAAQITKVQNGAKTTISISGIATGDTVMVLGSVSGSNVTAKTIIDGQFPPRLTPAASGIVSALNGNSFTVTSGGTAFAVDANNAQLMIIKPASTALSSSGLMSGDSVTVFGTVNGTNIAATKILDGKPIMGMMGRGFGQRPMAQ